MGLFGSFVQAFKDGYNGVDEEQDTAPSTKENTAQNPYPQRRLPLLKSRLPPRSQSSAAHAAPPSSRVPSSAPSAENR